MHSNSRRFHSNIFLFFLALGVAHSALYNLDGKKKKTSTYLLHASERVSKRVFPLARAKVIKRTKVYKTISTFKSQISI